MPLLENGKYVLSLLDNQKYCKINGAFKRHLAKHGMSEEDYLIAHELTEIPKCICCGELPQLNCGWKWKKNCKKPACVKAVTHPPMTQEHKAKISAASKAMFADEKWAKQHQAKMHAGNQVKGYDGLTGYERTKLKREQTMLKKYGHAQFANWEKTKQTWADKSDEEKDLYARQSSAKQMAFPLEKKQAITAKIQNTNLNKFGVIMPTNRGNGGYSKVAAKLFDKLDSNGVYRPKFHFEIMACGKSVDFCQGRKVIEFYGDYWHANPSTYASSHLISRKKMVAEHIWAKDTERIKKIEDAGYQVKIVWEKDFKRHPEKVIKECKEWLSNT